MKNGQDWRIMMNELLKDTFPLSSSPASMKCDLTLHRSTSLTSIVTSGQLTTQQMPRRLTVRPWHELGLEDRETAQHISTWVIFRVELVIYQKVFSGKSMEKNDDFIEVAHFFVHQCENRRSSKRLNHAEEYKMT